MTGLTAEEQALVDAAAAARDKAYAPYSRFQVGAAVRLADGRVLTGVNVENASFGLTVCAERNAVAASVLAGARPRDITAAAVATGAGSPVSPCGACRQVLAEFAPPDAAVLLHDTQSGETDRHTIRELLPHAFSSDQLPA